MASSKSASSAWFLGTLSASPALLSSSSTGEEQLSFFDSERWGGAFLRGYRVTVGGNDRSFATGTSSHSDLIHDKGMLEAPGGPSPLGNPVPASPSPLELRARFPPAPSERSCWLVRASLSESPERFHPSHNE
ncbi:hypothetical protein BJX68DRAFT_96176 [Aspergillus pseudodeflectus]|uniref:Secreted protein n=1 Tax=Aspergillus pseudodeflectus TaxID=176178 RepID=A0ABR4KBV1_9EURO